MEEILKILDGLKFEEKDKCINKIVELDADYIFLKKIYSQQLEELKTFLAFMKESQQEKQKNIYLEQKAHELEKENLELKKAFDLLEQRIEI